MGVSRDGRTDILIVGGGFYGCCLALFLRSVADRVTIVESRGALLTRASLVNQARIHTGFHYPRSFATAKRSLMLYKRFMNDFRDGVETNFRMLYAVARTGSKVSARRFLEMYRDLGAPIRPASLSDAGFFNLDLIEGVFECEEYAFDAERLRETLHARLDRAGVEIRFDTTVESFAPVDGGGVKAGLSSGEELIADLAFNATYGRLNRISRIGDPAMLPVKNELAEIALVKPPEALAMVGVTVMDGPFFSLMPFPSRKLHSLTHVRYTPQLAWVDGTGPKIELSPRSRWLNMQRDACRYMPSLRDLVWQESIFEIKTVLQKNEIDDGRPIFLHQHTVIPGLYSILGGKLDNIYDLFEALKEIKTERLNGADLRWFGDV